jgi:predicted ribosome quality control (RQC) complex YloA/Tae2 family protein
MFKNYFTLNRLTFELNKELKDVKIIRAFSFEKDKLVLVMSNKQDELSIEISVNPGVPYINLRRKFSIPKKNLVDFFKTYLPLKIQSVEIAENDRIIKINSDKASLYFTIRGKFTNFFLISKESEIESFKKTDDKITSGFQDEVDEKLFISEFNNLKITEKFVDPDSVRKKYPVIGKEIINEAKLRNGSTNKVSTAILLNVINEVKKNKPAVFIEENAGEVNLGLESFSIFPFTKKVRFSNLIEAFNYFIIQKFSVENLSDKKKIIEKHLENELKKVSGKLNDIQARIQKGTKEEEYNKIANLLLININDLPKGSDRIELQDIYKEDSSVSIKLDPKLSPKQNIDSYFEKSRNEKIKFEKAKQLSFDLEKKYSELKKVRDKYINAKSTEEYNSIMKELNIKQDEKKKPDDKLKNKFRHYLIHNKYNVYIGKDSRSNDLLTLKFAKQNDYWFHARGASGSHVVLKNENAKEGIPKNILKVAASLAAYHSKVKTSGMAPVSYTQKKYVIKKKGMEPGKVALLREEVLIVKPGIPEGCEYINVD